MPPKVVFIFSGEKYDVYIGRGMDPNTGLTPGWGNSYSHKEGTMARFKVPTVEDAVRHYREDVEKDPVMVARIKRELRGKTLACWCNSPRARGKKPKLPCHGDVLLEIANAEG